MKCLYFLGLFCLGFSLTCSSVATGQWVERSRIRIRSFYQPPPQFFYPQPAGFPQGYYGGGPSFNLSLNAYQGSNCFGGGYYGAGLQGSPPNFGWGGGYPTSPYGYAPPQTLPSFGWQGGYPTSPYGAAPQGFQPYPGVYGQSN
jgi:hypothetical protein